MQKKMELGFCNIVTILRIKQTVCHFKDETLRIPKW